MKLALLLCAALLALVSSLSPVHAQSCGARVRKDWDALTTAEKTTYKGALAAAMDSGAYIKFVEMHTEMMSEREAHQQCMFIYWHRLLLVAFENMLRGQGSQYACVTVPYYNWVGANNRFSTGTCSSLGDCSTITAELGGYTTGSQRTVSINGVSNSGRCVSQSPLDHFCQSGTVTGSACARCVPRGAWGSAVVPGSTSFASIRQQVFSGQNIGAMSPAVEQGCHNNVHASLDGTMGTFASPSDPIFWSHHSMVDALHTIFHKCRVGTQRLTFAQKAAHPVAWTSCARRNNGGNFNPTDVIVMRTGVNGRNPIEGSQDPLIGRYFSGVPNQFAGLMDVRDLGDSSYSYELSGQLADMYNNCDGTSTPVPTTPAPTTATRPTTTTPTAVPQPGTSAPIPTTSSPVTPVAPTAAPQQPSRWGWLDWIRNNRWGFGNGRRLEAQHGWAWPWGHGVQSNNIRGSDCDDNKAVVQSSGVTQSNAVSHNNAPASTPTAVPSYDAKNDNVDVITVDRTDAEEQRVSSWYSKTMATMGGDCPAVMADLERQMCMFQSQCLGGTPDYTPAFKALWGAKAPRCLTIVNAINSGEQQITYANWRQDMESHFGCPTPANAVQSADQNGGYSDVVQFATSTISSAVQSV
ncbi:Tyrosinase [Phytophthora ramorum]|uniref:Tyrosinase n=1 Tax=Phytophthora ramorum TaxID=164328 RepID=UPI0030AD0B0F|nr:Tyrosinase [Phytophthora ramorum]